ncbi:MAG: 4Fe-4S dicluster domain-containing protein [Spirochaetia bacterium]
MSIQKISEEGLKTWVAGLIEKSAVYGIQAKGDKFDFAPLDDAQKLRLDYDVSNIPPKKYFQPAREELVRFDEQGFKSVVDAEPFILLGVHPYDVAAIAQMDKLFALGNKDTHYLTRRQNATIIACDVQNASKNVFAGCLGFAAVDKGFDILLTKISDGYLVDSRTEKGNELCRSLAAAAASEKDLAERAEIQQRNKELLQKHTLKADPQQIAAGLEKGYDNPIWEEKAALCFSCGSCNLVCPTCYCFDVQDDMNWDMKSGVRSRSWDGCMLENFATVAGDHNFRKNKADRYRHRYYRKGLYVPQKIDEISCVGCGRCITACVSHIAHPVEVFNRITEDAR